MIVIKLIFLVAIFKCSFAQKSLAKLIADKGIGKPTDSIPIKTTTINPEIVPVTTSAPVKVPGGTIEKCGIDKECIGFLQCNDGKAITDGDFLIDPRDNLANTCSHYMDVCCEIPNVLTTPKIIPTPPVTTKCGMLNPNGILMKIDKPTEHEAQFGEFPWMVAVLKKEIVMGKTKNVFNCGGSLIHPSVVMTTAHSVDELNPMNLRVRAGEWDTQTTREPLSFVESDVVSMIVHENLNKRTGTFNIALLFLETPINNAQHINTICLPPPDTYFDNERCFVTGWGKTTFGQEGKYSVILKKIEMPVLDHQTCTEMLKKTRLGRNYIFHEGLICAGGEEGIDTCKGDGGSPLVCPVPGQNGRYYQAGIVAWGIGCGISNTPGAYTSVSYFADWIAAQIQINGYNAANYI